VSSAVFTGPVGLTVLNVNLDTFGSYGGGGIDDARQNNPSV